MTDQTEKPHHITNPETGKFVIFYPATAEFEDPATGETGQGVLPAMVYLGLL